VQLRPKMSRAGIRKVSSFWVHPDVFICAGKPRLTGEGETVGHNVKDWW